MPMTSAEREASEAAFRAAARALFVSNEGCLQKLNTEPNRI